MDEGVVERESVLGAGSEPRAALLDSFGKRHDDRGALRLQRRLRVNDRPHPRALSYPRRQSASRDIPATPSRPYGPEQPRALQSSQVVDRRRHRYIRQAPIEAIGHLSFEEGVVEGMRQPSCFARLPIEVTHAPCCCYTPKEPGQGRVLP